MSPVRCHLLPSNIALPSSRWVNASRAASTSSEKPAGSPEATIVVSRLTLPARTAAKVLSDWLGR